MKKKVLSVLLSMTMLAGIVTGCGGAAQTAADQLDAQGVEEIPVAEETAPAAEASTEEAAPAEAEGLDLSQACSTS